MALTLFKSNLQSLQLALTRVKKLFQYQQIPTEPQRLSCSKPILLFSVRIPGTANALTKHRPGTMNSLPY